MDNAAPAKTLTLEDIPSKKCLEDGSKVLAETSAYLLLERGVTKKCGGYVEPHQVQLLRLPMSSTPGAKTPSFKLVVLPREGDKDAHAHEVVLDRGVKITPALRQLRKKRTHFVKPDGESLVKTIAKLDGEEIRLYTYEVKHSSGVAFFDMLGLKQKVVGLGFTDLDEALGWYVYTATCASIMDQSDPDFRKVIGHHVTLADHAAATHAVILGLDDTPEPAGATAAAPAAEAAAAAAQ